MTEHEILHDLVRLRLSQMVINEHYKQGSFKIPIHLALGHESVAVALSAAMEDGDQWVLSHRNIHFNLARHPSLRSVLDEYLLKPTGLAEGELGSMNLCNEPAGVVYSSSILGNNLAVATGLALANRIQRRRVLVTVVTGDGAIEEGGFYESLLFQKSNHLACCTLIENNQWSLGSKIEERRCPIDVATLVSGLDIPYERLSGNDALTYVDALRRARARALDTSGPVCLEIDVTTLGHWREVTPATPAGRFVNYHAGPARTIDATTGPVIEETDADPLYVAQQRTPPAEMERIVREIRTSLEDELR